MKICVAGLWHLGSVTAAGLAHIGHDVIGLDDDSQTIENLRNAQPPLFEPGLAELIRENIGANRLRFTSNVTEAVTGAELVWITYDTPVDDDDRADVEFVIDRVERLFEHLADGTLVVVSSQLPVGSVRRLEESYARRGRREQVSFACSPENLRLGTAIRAFLEPARIVAGVRLDRDREKFVDAVERITTNIEWMSVESAEMTKHALNAFLATSIAFINEIATACEATGADAKEVERGLKSDPRIGSRAYLSAGGAFAGGTLARDIAFLSALRPLQLIPAVKASNDQHQSWARQKLQSTLGDLRGRRIAVWGLTYKPGTDTLRRSTSVELCRWLASHGAEVRAHDPAVKSLPADLASIIQFSSDASETILRADAVVIATEWPEYRALAPALLTRTDLVIIDANRFVLSQLEARVGARWFAVGKGAS